jgi:hypothetical protein
MLDEAKQTNPNFNIELSIDANEKIEDPQRYRGYTQFALWFLRPSIIRQTTSKTSKDEINPLFQEVIDSVELINYNDILADFWQNGKLVQNGTSPLDKNIPSQYKNTPRWFLLDTDSEEKVWAFALVKGEKPNREWLVYVQSPDGNKTDVTVTIPKYKDILIDGTQNGSFYILNMKNLRVVNTTSVGSGDTDIDIKGNGKTYFLDNTNGLDSNDGSKDSPFKNIKQATSILNSGDTLNIREGIYKIDTPIIINANKTSKSPKDRITIQSYNNEQVIIDGINFNKEKKQSLIDLWGRSYITIKKLHLKNSTFAGVNVAKASHISIISNIIENTAISAIFVNGTYITIKGNECKYNNYSGDQEAISISKSNNILILNNEVHHNGNKNNHKNGIGIDVKDGGSNITIADNYVHDMDTDGIYLDARGWLKNIDIYDNTVRNCGNRGIKIANETPIGGSENINIYNNISIFNLDGIVIGQDRMPPNIIKNVNVVNNIVWRNIRDGIVAGTKMSSNPLDDKPDNIIIVNNIISENGHKAIAVYGNVEKDPYTIDTNIIYGETDWKGKNTFNIKPKFIDVNSSNFKLMNNLKGTDKYFIPNNLESSNIGLLG